MSTKKADSMTNWREHLYSDWFQLAISSFIIALGISLNNVPIVVGGLLIVPLLDSVMKTADILANGNFLSLYKEFIRFSILCLIVVLVAWLSIVVFGSHSRFSIFSNSTSSSFIYLVVAFLSGFGVTLLRAKKSINVQLGFVLGVALMPPLVLMGMNLGLLDMAMVIFYCLTFILNFFGAVMGSLVFLLLSRFKE